MSLEEKRRKLANYCTNTDCGECVLRAGGWSKPVYDTDCPNIRESPEEDLNRAIAIIDSEEYNCCECRYFGFEYNDTVCVGCRNHTSPSDPEYMSKPIKWVPAESSHVAEEDLVNHPSHYTSGGIECLDAIKASMTHIEYAGFLKGQVLKYVWRYRLKGKPHEDLKKARFYLDRLIQVVENDEVS